jgi:hypothetical protein
MEGTKTARPVWGGRAWLEEIEADGPDGHWEGATLFLYDVKAGQWSQSYIDSDTAVIGSPTVGSFKEGRAELFATEVYQGRNVLVRGVWSDITADSHRYEISYSQDGGRTWVTGFSAYLTRISDAKPAATTPRSAADSARLSDGAHDFDFIVGVWSAHLRHILDPFAGGHRVVELDGTIAVDKVWHGRAWLEQIDAQGPGSHWGGLAVFLYNPKTRQWSQSFVNGQSGAWAAPLIGDFRRGRGELYSQDNYDGRSILVRGVWSNIGPNSHDYMESLSDDGGATWRPGLLVHWTRIQP